MEADCILTNCKLAHQTELVSVFISKGVFVDFKPKSEVRSDDLVGLKVIDIKGQLMLPSLIETHIHLDKACIFSQCVVKEGTLSEAIEQTSKAKRQFTYEDVYLRGKAVLEKAIRQGTGHMRTHVEVDPIVGLVSFDAIQQLKYDYAWAITIEICVFPQEGLNNHEGTFELLEQALKKGADVLGGCPYTDSDPYNQIQTLFQLAKKYDVDLDFHLDFDLDKDNMSLPDVIKFTDEYCYAGRVTVGHVTKLSALPYDDLVVIANKMAQSGVALTTLPSTDLFLVGREYQHNIPRGVLPLKQLSKAGVCCSISTNNINNPFTPYGDCSQVRQANLYANVAQLATPEDLSSCFNWVSSESAKLLRKQGYGIDIGNDADVIFFDANESFEVIGNIELPKMGMKKGVITFTRPETSIHYPTNQ